MPIMRLAEVLVDEQEMEHSDFGQRQERHKLVKERKEMKRGVSGRV